MCTNRGKYFWEFQTPPIHQWFSTVDQLENFKKQITPSGMYNFRVKALFWKKYILDQIIV